MQQVLWKVLIVQFSWQLFPNVSILNFFIYIITMDIRQRIIMLIKFNINSGTKIPHKKKQFSSMIYANIPVIESAVSMTWNNIHIFEGFNQYAYLCYIKLYFCFWALATIIVKAKKNFWRNSV